MALPVVSVTRPKAIAGLNASQISKTNPQHLKKRFFHGVGYGYLNPVADRCFAALFIALWAAHKITLTITSTADAWRSYQVQLNAFNTRYTLTWSLEVNGLTNRFANRRYWDDGSGQGRRTYYLRKNMIPCATPGSGWHPYGLAADVAVWVPTLNDGNSWPGGASAIRGNEKAWTWMKENCVSLGWSWENSKEGVDDPHLHYFAGDKIPQRVLDIEAYLAAAAAKP